MSRRVPAAALLIALAVVAVAAPTSAQTPTGLHGLVVDFTRSPVVGARVTATPSTPGPALSAVTGARGEFTLTLAPVAYILAIESAGFVRIEQRIDGQRLAQAPRQFVLDVAGIAETVDVSVPGGYKVPAISSA